MKETGGASVRSHDKCPINEIHCLFLHNELGGSLWHLASHNAPYLLRSSSSNRLSSRERWPFIANLWWLCVLSSSVFAFVKLLATNQFNLIWPSIGTTLLPRWCVKLLRYFVMKAADSSDTHVSASFPLVQFTRCNANCTPAMTQHRHKHTYAHTRTPADLCAIKQNWDCIRNSKCKGKNTTQVPNSTTTVAAAHTLNLICKPNWL